MIVKFQSSADKKTWCIFDNIHKVRFREEADKISVCDEEDLKTIGLYDKDFFFMSSRYEENLPAIEKFDDSFLVYSHNVISKVSKIKNATGQGAALSNDATEIQKLIDCEYQGTTVKVRDLLPDMKYSVMILISTDGSERSVIFDGVAYICNDSGKTIEKVVGH